MRRIGALCLALALLAGCAGGSASTPHALRLVHTGGPVTVTPADTPAATPATGPAAPSTPPATPNPARPPSSPATPATVAFVGVTGSQPGGTASVSVVTTPGASCTISYVTPAGTKDTAAGLTPRAADGAGHVAWSWTLDASTTPGTGRVTVTCDGVGASSPITIG